METQRRRYGSTNLLRIAGKLDDVIIECMKERDDNIKRYSLGLQHKLLVERDVLASLMYLLQEVRQGVYCIILCGKLRFMCVMANMEYENKFTNLKFTEDNISLDEYVSKKRRRFGKEKGTMLPVNKWWFSHGIVCNIQSDSKFGWGLGMIHDYINTLKQVCSSNYIDDCEFILNRRDIPMLRKDGQHCYQFASSEAGVYTDLTSILPVYSLYQGSFWLDKPLIEPKEPEEISNIEWSKKVELAFFRGSCTGSGITKKDNVRIFLANLSQSNPDFFDCGITSLSKRDKVNDGVVNFDRKENVSLSSAIPMKEWAKNKYIIYAEGYSAALRMAPMLSSRSVVLFLDGFTTAHLLWFFHKLVFVNMEVSSQLKQLCPPEANMIFCNCTNILGAVKWLKANDSLAREIAENGYKLYEWIKSNRYNFQANQFNNAFT